MIGDQSGHRHADICKDLQNGTNADFYAEIQVIRTVRGGVGELLGLDDGENQADQANHGNHQGDDALVLLHRLDVVHGHQEGRP